MGEDFRPIEAILIMIVSVFIAFYVWDKVFPDNYSSFVVPTFQKVKTVFQDEVK